jgi:hypothetical protein
MDRLFSNTEDTEDTEDAEQEESAEKDYCAFGEINFDAQPSVQACEFSARSADLLLRDFRVLCVLRV